MILDRLFLVTLTEAQAALAVLIGTAAVAGWIARRQRMTGALPRTLIWWGLLGTSTVVALPLTPGNMNVFLASNQIRLLWLLGVAIWLLVSNRRNRHR